MAKAAAVVEAPKLTLQESVTVQNQVTAGSGVPFSVVLTRAGKTVNGIVLSRHPRVETTCSSCQKSGAAMTISATIDELGKLIQLLQQVKNDVIPGLEKYGVEE